MKWIGNLIGYLTVICTISSDGKIVNEALMFTNKAVKLSKGPFMYYVNIFLAFLTHLPNYVRMNSAVNQKKLPFSGPTHPTIC